MEIIASKSNLLKAISMVSAVAAQKANTLPILGNILLEARQEGTLKLIGTDLEVGISTIIPVQVTKEGEITIPAKKIQEIVRELPEGDVEILVAKNNAVNIRAGKSFFKIMGLAKEDYPKFPEWSIEEAIEIEQEILKECLTLTCFASSHDETRYVLNGVLIAAKGDQLRFVATDGRRLAFYEKKFENRTGKEFEAIVPAKAIQELLKLLQWEGKAQIVVTQNQIMFCIAETYLVSRLIEGHFPNYEQVIPKQEKTLSAVDKEELLQAIRRTALLTTPDAPAVKFDFVKGKILISSRSPNLGEAKEEVGAESKGHDLAIGFNPYYLTDVLKHLDVDKITVSLTESDKPGLVRGKEGYQYVVMPMQLT